jgi:hypothetical protein
METEIKKYCQILAKRVYPITEKEKTCINEHGKRTILRGKLEKRIIETISKYEQEAEANLLESGKEQADKVHSEISY